MRYEDNRDLIADVAAANNVPVALIEQLLSLEPRYINLGQPNARRQLQSEVGELIDHALRTRSQGAT